MAREFTPPHTTHKVGILSKTASTQRRIQIQEFEDREVLDIRDWYKKRGDDTYSPGKGLTIKVTDIPRLIELLEKAERIAIAEDLLE
jgi:hypothetical protein